MQASHVTILLVTLASISGECSRTDNTLPPAESARTLQALPGLPLQIALPRDAKVQATSNGVRIVIHPGMRSPLGIDIMRDDTGGSFLGANTKTRALTPSLQLTYREQVLPGGSGGEDAVLDGLLTLATTTYRITCNQQSEWQPSAQACLPVLATLRSLPQNR